MAQQLAFALGLAAIHLYAGKLQRLNALPRSAGSRLRAVCR